jgi:hypothetical protein
MIQNRRARSPLDLRFTCPPCLHRLQLPAGADRAGEQLALCLSNTYEAPKLACAIRIGGYFAAATHDIYLKGVA